MKLDPLEGAHSADSHSRLYSSSMLVNPKQARDIGWNPENTVTLDDIVEGLDDALEIRYSTPAEAARFLSVS